MSKPTRHGKKRSAGSGDELEPIGDADVEAAFAGLRLESEPRGASVYDEMTAAFQDNDESSDFAPEQLEEAEIRKADSPTRRAQTQPAIFDAVVDGPTVAKSVPDRDSGKFTASSVEPRTSIVTDELIEEEAPAYNVRPRAPSERAESSFDVDMDELVAAVSAPQAPAVSLPRSPTETPRASSQSLPRVEESDAGPLPEQPIASLRVGVHESATNLSSAGFAIAAAGHAMTMGASGREGLSKLQRACADGLLDALIVGLPEGEWLIRAALALAPHAPVVIAACSGKPAEAIRMANAAGADLVAIRPHDAERIATVLLAAARIADRRNDVARAQTRQASLLERFEADGEDDDAEVGGLQPFEAFQRTLELELKRVRRYQYALSVALFSLELPDPAPPGVAGILKARSGNALIQTIRDIDMATEIDTGRFLVLLPYTDLTGATNVARRIITAVDSLPAVNLGGKEYRAQLTGAIAGAKPGRQVSFGKLIRDANRALEAARRDGAELAVQP